MTDKDRSWIGNNSHVYNPMSRPVYRSFNIRNHISGIYKHRNH